MITPTDSVKKLNIAGCRNIPKNFFDNLSNIKELSIEEAHKGLNRGMYNLEKLYIYGYKNADEFLTDLHVFSPNIRELKAHFVRNNVEQVIKNLLKLEKLYVSFYDFIFCPCELFEKYRRLKSLKASGKHVQISDEKMDLWNAEEFYISSCSD